MSNNFLHLNKSQSGIVLFGSADSVHLIHNHCGSLSVCIKLGVLFDSDLSLEFCFFQLRNITKMIFFIFSTLLSRRVWTTVTILTLSSSSLFPVSTSESGSKRLNHFKETQSRLCCHLFIGCP